jgi:hypothetical protein
MCDWLLLFSLPCCTYQDHVIDVGVNDLHSRDRYICQTLKGQGAALCWYCLSLPSLP